MCGVLNSHYTGPRRPLRAAATAGQGAAWGARMQGGVHWVVGLQCLATPSLLQVETLTADGCTSRRWIRRGTERVQSYKDGRSPARKSWVAILRGGWCRVTLADRARATTMPAAATGYNNGWSPSAALQEIFNGSWWQADQTLAGGCGVSEAVARSRVLAAAAGHPEGAALLAYHAIHHGCV